MSDIVNAVFIGADGVLLARRSPQRKNYPDCWSFPGGHVEEEESLADALTREIEEELAVTNVKFEPLMRISDPKSVEPIIYHMYLIREWLGVPKIVDTEHPNCAGFRLMRRACWMGLLLRSIGIYSM